MTNDELNRKCAELAGFRLTLAGWIPPEGLPDHVLSGPDYIGCPAFTTSIDACAKWLWPVVKAKGVSDEYEMCVDGIQDEEGSTDFIATPRIFAKAFIAVMEGK